MRNHIIKRLIILLIVTVLFVGCNKTENAPPANKDEAEERVKLEYLLNHNAAEVDKESELLKKIEDRFNVDLYTWYVDPNKFNETLNIRLAGGEMPDVLLIKDLDQLPQYVDGGIVHELPIELIRENAPHYSKAADENDPNGDLWTTLSYKGKNYGIAHPLAQYPKVLAWRKDWLEAVGIEKAPETIEEMEIALTKFANEDPDDDGLDNTYGMAERAMNAVFGAFGLRIAIGSSPGFLVEEMQLKDGVPIIPYIRPEAKEALAVLRDWHEKGLIHPEFITGENHGGYRYSSHLFSNGQIGVTLAQYYHFFPYGPAEDPKLWGRLQKELRDLQPDAQVELAVGIKGPTGLSGTEGWGRIGKFTALTTKCFEDERKVEKVLEMVDEYYEDMDYAKMATYGLEGVHMTNTEYGPSRINGVDLRKDGVMMFGYGATIPFVENVRKVQAAYAEDLTKDGVGFFRFNIPPTEEFSNVIANLDAITEKAYIEIITGAKPLDYFDEYVIMFKENGGELAEKAAQEAYSAKQNGK